MQIQQPRLISRTAGRLHHTGDNEYLASCGRDILASNDEGASWRRIATVPATALTRLKSSGRLLRRLFRSEIHHIVPVDDHFLTVFAFGRIFVLDRRSGAWADDPQAVRGSRPLGVCQSGGNLYYGEYLNNVGRMPVHVHCSRDSGRSWASVYQLSGVRHIHGVYHDPYSGSLWFTTGDNDDECGIWVTHDDFRSVTKVLGGSQQYRAVDLIFTEDHVYYGTDTPLEMNHIYRFRRNGNSVDQLAPAPSSVFYGAHAGGRIFFGAVCEPSVVNETRHSVILGSDHSGVNWREVARLRKDIWPMKYFQYGQVRFPRGQTGSNLLWLSPLSVEHDQTMCCINLDHLQ